MYLDIYFSINNTSYITTIGAVVGIWNHFAVVRNGTTITLYVNGVGTSFAIGGTLSTENNVGGILFHTIGAATNGFWPFNGYLDELRVIKGSAYYTANFIPPTAALPN